MWYINPTANSGGNYGNPHNPAREGDYELPDILVPAYTEAKGFVDISVEDGVVTACEKNEAAYEAYMAEHPVLPEPPTDLERLEAQLLYTAMMTETLLEDEEE